MSNRRATPYCWLVTNAITIVLRGKLKMRRFAFAALGLVASTGLAGAWSANIEGPDVFGVTKVIATEGGDREGMVIQCDSKDALHFAFIFRKKEFEPVTEAPATLYVQIDGASPVKLDASLREWNDIYGGFVVTGRDGELLSLLQSLGRAKSKVNIGAEVYGQQSSASFSARGSTKTVEQLTKFCNLHPPA